MDIHELTRIINNLINEDAAVADAPVKTDRRSFKGYLKSKIAKNDLDWLEGEIDWDAEYRDPNDGYTWYFPMRYAFNAEKVAEAVRRNLNRGRLECRVDIDWWEDRTDEPLLRVRFKNNKLQRETGIDNLSDEYENIVKEWQEQRNNGVKSLRDYLYGTETKGENLKESDTNNLYEYKVDSNYAVKPSKQIKKSYEHDDDEWYLEKDETYTHIVDFINNINFDDVRKELKKLIHYTHEDEMVMTTISTRREYTDMGGIMSLDDEYRHYPHGFNILVYQDFLTKIDLSVFFDKPNELIPKNKYMVLKFTLYVLISQDGYISEEDCGMIEGESGNVTLRYDKATNSIKIK